MAESYQNVNKTILFNFLILSNIFFILIRIIRLHETFEKKTFMAERSAQSPHSEYSLAPLARFEFRVSKHFLFGLIWDYKTSGDLRKKN
jgi:hypothetical protein